MNILDYVDNNKLIIDLLKDKFYNMLKEENKNFIYYKIPYHECISDFKIKDDYIYNSHFDELVTTKKEIVNVLKVIFDMICNKY